MNRRTAADKVLRDKAYDGYQRGLASIVDEIFSMKTFGGAIKNEVMSNKDLAGDLHKLFIGKFEKRKVHSFLRHWFCRHASDK